MPIIDSDQLALRISRLAHAHMGRMGKSSASGGYSRRKPRVAHHRRFSLPSSLDPAELDAVEAFLMQVVNAIIKNAGGSRRPQTSSFCQQIQTDVSRKSELAWSNTSLSAAAALPKMAYCLRYCAWYV